MFLYSAILIMKTNMKNLFVSCISSPPSFFCFSLPFVPFLTLFLNLIFFCLSLLILSAALLPLSLISNFFFFKERFFSLSSQRHDNVSSSHPPLSSSLFSISIFFLFQRQIFVSSRSSSWWRSLCYRLITLHYRQ